MDNLLLFAKKKIQIAVQLTSTHPFFVGASCIHPSFVDVKDAEKAGAPVLSIASRDEPDMVSLHNLCNSDIKRHIDHFLLLY